MFLWLHKRSSAVSREMFPTTASIVRDMIHPTGLSRKTATWGEKWLLKSSRPVRMHRAHVGPTWGTANYYLIVRITEYNGSRPLKATATTPGINELWRDINSGLNTTRKSPVVKPRFTSIRQDLPYVSYKAASWSMEIHVQWDAGLEYGIIQFTTHIEKNIFLSLSLSVCQFVRFYLFILWFIYLYTCTNFLKFSLILEIAKYI